MDTLKLLSRSSGVKFNRVSENKASQIPSAGGNISIGNDQKSGSRKRKHDELEQPTGRKVLSEIEIRQIQKQHKIRITDLHALHNDQTSETRKVQKESSRLFPQPLQSFTQLKDLNVNKTLISNVAEQAYKEPTEVQLATIPLLIRNGVEEPNLLTVAPTGSGKTLAFLIPLINKINYVNNQATDENRHVSALVLAPTKELVSQIVNEGRKLTAKTGVRITELRKGMRLHTEDEAGEVEEPDSEDDDSDHETNKASIVVKADILVATPLSLVNAITPKSATSPYPMPHITTLVLDEADVLLDPLFRDQTLSIWSACTSQDLRVSLWSATIGSSIEALAISTINARPSSKQSPPLLRTIIGLKDTSLPSITHKLIYASTEPGKLMGLRQLIHPSSSSSSDSTTLRPPFIIFTQTIPRAQSLYTELQYDIPSSAGGSSRIAVLHSSLTTHQRSTTMSLFRSGKIWILITTDLLSRGIDFRGVNGIVNYDIPTTSASYVHRAGRTGRAGREGGIAVTFYTREDVKYLKPIANIISSSTSSGTGVGESVENQLPDWLIPSLPFLTQKTKKDIKTRGVDVRRAVKESDNDKERRVKLKNRIGTTSGYERKLEGRRKGMVEGSIRRKNREREGRDGDADGEGEGDEWTGFG